MRVAIAIILAVLVVGPAFCAEWEAVVIKATSRHSEDTGTLVIELPSGRTIELGPEDWSRQWSEAVTKALKDQEMKAAAESSAAPPSDAAAEVMIRSHCTKEWPDDYRMRKYCQDQQFDGLRALRSRQMSGALAQVRSKCAKEWPDDYRMRDYCENQQLQAIRELGN